MEVDRARSEALCSWGTSIDSLLARVPGDGVTTGNEPAGEEVQASLTPCSLMRESKSSSLTDLCPPACPARFQEEMGFVRAPHGCCHPSGFCTARGIGVGPVCLEDPGPWLLLGLFPGCLAPSSPTHHAPPPKGNRRQPHSPSLANSIWGVGGTFSREENMGSFCDPRAGGGGAWAQTVAISP